MLGWLNFCWYNNLKWWQYSNYSIRCSTTGNCFNMSGLWRKNVVWEVWPLINSVVWLQPTLYLKYQLFMSHIIIKIYLGRTLLLCINDTNSAYQDSIFLCFLFHSQLIYYSISKLLLFITQVTLLKLFFWRVR